MTELFSSLFGTQSVLIGTILPFLIVLTVVVFVHEMGHYLVGRWCGIGVKAFSVGFGPEIIGFNDRSGTRWKLSAIPLGGYVKFAGDESVTSAVAADVETMSAAERAVAFHTQPVWKRAATVFAGPAFNILLTVAIFSVFFGLYGRMVADPMVAEVRPGGPAAIAGFQPGDRFVRVDGDKVETFADVQRHVSARAGDALDFVVERAGKEFHLTATPELLEQKDALGNSVKIAVIGVVNNQELGNFRRIEYGPLESVGQAVKESGFIIARTGQFFGRFFAGREDKCQLGGPVKIATMAGQAASQGVDWLIQLTAMLSIGIGLLNLFPLPPLDGGHLVFYAAEAVIGRPVKPAVQEIFFRAGFFLVLGFMGFVIFNDLFAC
ncbi:MAG: RIP metalloprotease RseP [Phyllobacterium sp.]